MTLKRCYLSGPITGTDDYHERFEQAIKEVVKLDMIPVNPVTLPHQHDKEWHSYMREAMAAMLTCEAMYMMENWIKSEGANIELTLAEQLHFKIFYQHSKYKYVKK